MRVTTKGFPEGIARLKAALARMVEMEDLAKQLGDIVATSSRSNIEESRTPGGAPFLELAPSTVKWKKSHNKDPRPLIRSHALIDSIAARLPVRSGRSTTVSVGFGPWYGALHNEGDGGMPQRQFMGVRADDIDRERVKVREFALTLFGAR